MSRDKVEKVRTILKHADSEMKQSIQSGKSINKAYKEIQMKRREEKDDGGSISEVFPAVPEHVSLRLAAAEKVEALAKLVEGDHGDFETFKAAHDSTLHEIRALTEASNAARCWALKIINEFDSGSLDYIIVGQGTPPDNLTENQQVFIAQRMAPSQDESIDPAEDAPNAETSTPAPPKEPNRVNLTNYDAEGWYELEKQWAKYIPGFVPDPPEGIEVATVIEETSVEGNAASGNEEPEPSPQSEVQAVDPALEKIATSLEMGHGEWTRLEKWAKRTGVIVYTMPDNTRQIDRRKFFALVQSVKELNDVLKGPVRPQYAWFPQTFHQICLENGHDVAVPDCADGFEVNLLLDHLCFKGIYSGGRHHPQNEESIMRKLKFLVENWTEVCAGVKEFGFVQDRPDSPTFDWVVSHGENVFNCIHHKMQAIARVQCDQIFENAGIALN